MSDPQAEQDDRDRAYSFMSSDSGVDTTPNGRRVIEKPLKSVTTYDKYPPSGIVTESTKSISFSSPVFENVGNNRINDTNVLQ